MHFALFDSGGNLIESYDNEDEARAALGKIVQEEPEAANDVALITLDDEGHAVGDPVTIEASGSLAAY